MNKHQQSSRKKIKYTENSNINEEKEIESGKKLIVVPTNSFFNFYFCH